MPRVNLLISLIFIAFLATGSARAELPNLNEDSLGGLTLDKEYQLGRNWVRSLRRQAPLMEDPASTYYLEQLVWKLAANSQLNDLRLEIVTLDNATFNAFAVPGGIVGLHGGLLLAAENEGELASVVAHELAHLSQRHFAAQLEQQRQSKPLVLAGMLAGILLSAADSDAGTAAITSTMAANVGSQLAFSRRNEQEADRIGMQTLVASGYNPHAMPGMFSRLLDSYRFASRPPEFLSTHPVSESRIADSEGRAAQLAGNNKSPKQDPLLFSLIKARLTANYHSNPASLTATLEDSLENAGNNVERQRLRYALYVAAIYAGQFDTADNAYKQLDNKSRKHWLVQLTRAEKAIAIQDTATAISILRKQLSLYPDNFPLQQRLAEAYQQSGDASSALKLYRKLALKRPTDANIHYQIAEVYGLTGDIAGVHRSRIEYFLLTGDIDSALRQIKFARRERGLSETDRQQLEQLELEAKEIQKQMKMEL